MKSDECDNSHPKMVNPGVAPVDIGSTMHMAAAIPDSDDRPVRSRLDGHLKHPILLICEKFIGIFDLVELEPVRDQLAGVDPS